MNLVAKEYIAAQNPFDLGVLVLSNYAGAARELETALLVKSARRTTKWLKRLQQLSRCRLMNAVNGGRL